MTSIIMTDVVNMLLLLFMVVTALGVVRLRNLFAVVMLSSVFSLLSAGMFLMLDSVDVAFTEASVGAGISTVLILATLSLTTSTEKGTPAIKPLPLLVVLATGAALIYGSFDMPPFGDPANAIHAHVADRYIEQSGTEVGLPNIVTSVLASYRGFDTLGEVTVIFTAGISVMLLMGLSAGAAAPKRRIEGIRHHLILRAGAKLLIPFIMLFALYVQFHGDYGPGGGFQAGIIFAAAFVLYGLIFGVDNFGRVVPAGVQRTFVAFGVLLYAGVGVASLVLGGNYLDYSVLAHDPVHGQHLGITLIELGVGITVAAVMMTIFYSFARRPPP